ncbi:MAG: hypothetical protein GY711_10165 [bacterium]|nr:hypothetical protein [bacterium]
MSKSAIARLERIAWSTVARWIERASEAACRVTRGRVDRVVLREVQLDEIRTFLGPKKRTTWVNFIRPHSSLPGRRTPAMQAGLVSRKLTFRQVFTFRVRAFSLTLVRSGEAPAAWPGRGRFHAPRSNSE